MYHVCTRSDGPICQGRGKNRKAVMFFGFGDAVNFAKLYAIKHQKVVEIFDGHTDVFDKNKDKKIAAYNKRGAIIYYNKEK